MFTGKDNITTEELGKLAREINAKKVFKRPIIKHKYTQGDWNIDPKASLRITNGNITICSISYGNSQSFEEEQSNTRLISQAPKMHQLCEAMFDILKDTNSLYLTLLEDVLNKINPK